MSGISAVQIAVSQGARRFLCQGAPVTVFQDLELKENSGHDSMTDKVPSVHSSTAVMDHTCNRADACEEGQGLIRSAHEGTLQQLSSVDVGQRCLGC